MDEELKRETQQAGKKQKKKEKDPEKLKALFSSSLEQSIMPNISRF